MMRRDLVNKIRPPFHRRSDETGVCIHEATRTARTYLFNTILIFLVKVMPDCVPVMVTVAM